MAIHFTPIRSLPHTTPPAPRRVAEPAARAVAASVRKPEAPLPSFHAVAASAATPAPTSAASNPAPSDWITGFDALFGGKSTKAADPPAAAGPPTAQSVFGANPWLDDPTGQYVDGSAYGYNQQYFATPQTAAAVAQMVGGTVVQANEMTPSSGSPFQQRQPNQMVQLKNGALINPGLVAGFYTHGYPQSMIDQMIANEVAHSGS